MGHALTIGTFDGVHAGHRALARRARALADEGSGGGRVTALVFDPHPATVVRPGGVPSRLSSFAMRERLLKEVGVDRVVRLEPTRELLSRSAAEFVEWLAGEYHPTVVVEGADFRFGRGRGGDVALLGEMGVKRGFTCDVVAPVDVVLTDHSVVTASSSIARWLVEQGRVRDAALVLGRSYAIEGTVSRGDRRGRELGFPTANIETEFLIPGDGIYAGRAVLPDGRAVAAGVHVGPRETFGDSRRVVEAHLLGVKREAGGAAIEGLGEYGWPITLECVAWLRDPMRFESVGALVEQMRADCVRARAVVAGGEWPAPGPAERGTKQEAPV